jgi:hypothetical protein
MLLTVAYSAGLTASAMLGSGLAFAGAIPLVYSLVVWAALRRRCTTGSHLSIFWSSTLVGLFFAWALIGFLMIAPWNLPVAVGLLAALLLTPYGPDLRSAAYPRTNR